MDEFVDLGVMNLNGETAITGPTPGSATTHSLCSGLPCGFGSDGHTVDRLPNHAYVFSDNYCNAIVPDCTACRTLLRRLRWDVTYSQSLFGDAR
jgi:hypothetical protein